MVLYLPWAMRETVKELAQLDGAFVVSSDGVILSAARYLEAPAEGEILPELFGIGRDSIFIPDPIIDESKDQKITIVTRKRVAKK